MTVEEFREHESPDIQYSGRRSAMKLPGFLPEELRQLARFVPSRGWDAVEWRPMLAALRRLSWRLATGAGVQGQQVITQAWVDRVSFGPHGRDAMSLYALGHAAQKRSAGDRILYLYFRQWLVEEGLFLDLRPGRFAWSDRRLVFSPNGLWLQLRPEFRTGMLELYRSFYADDEPALRRALMRMGMLRPGMDPAAEDELIVLLDQHFGMESGAQRFSIDAFKASFDRLFDFFLAHDYRLHSDFVFVGFYLITLYLSLETLGQKHDVRRICAEALNETE
jgi:predicted unusual protein kinase regulating ubiquinone biosynthesis (AarF/ABC1/UbiB family)